MALYEALGIEKEEIERGKPWQSYVETTFNIQRRMADFHFEGAENWPELAGAHARWLADYNAQKHWAHRERADGRRSPEEVLGWLTGVRYRDEDLERAFFCTRHTRKLDALGYARFRHWRLYAEESLAGREAALWLEPKTLTMEYAGEALSRYEVRRSADGAELREVGKATMFETSIVVHQPKLFDLASALGEDGWLKAVRMDDYAPRAPKRPELPPAGAVRLHRGNLATRAAEFPASVAGSPQLLVNSAAEESARLSCMDERNTDLFSSHSVTRFPRAAA